MDEGSTSSLTSREVMQLQLSLKSRSIREVALTVCTIRSLAKEVKSILQDLCYDEPLAHHNVTPVNCGPQVIGGRAENSFNVLPMPPPDPFQNVTPALPSLNRQPSKLGLSLGTRSYVKMLRRHRCPHCPRTFTTQSSVYRHIKSHHSNLLRGLSRVDMLPAPPNLTQATTLQTLSQSLESEVKSSDIMSVSLLHDGESSSDKASSVFPQADTSVTTPLYASADENKSGAMSPLASSSHQPSSPEDHLSPMPSLADMFSSRSQSDSVNITADVVKGEPDDRQPLSICDIDADIEITSPLHTHYQSETENATSELRSHDNRNIPPSGEVENQIREAVEAELRHNISAGMYQCTDCGWRSKSISSMRSHMLSHKGILPFKCNICSYKTNKKHVLMRHYTIHTGEKPHKCPICSFGSLDHVELLKHMNKSHPGIHPYTCTVCGHHSTTTLLLKKHMKAEHSMTPPRVRALSGGEKTISTTASSPSAVSASSSSGPAAPSAASSSSPGSWRRRRKIDSASETIYSSAGPTSEVGTSFSADNQPVFPS